MSAFLAAFASTFVSVFALGVQSLNVNQRMYLAAVITSAAISSGHLWLYKVMPTATGWDIAGYYLGGMAGIAIAIWSHPRIKALFERRRERRSGQVPPRRNPPPPRLQDEHQDVARCGSVTIHACGCGTPRGLPCPRLVCERPQ